MKLLIQKAKSVSNRLPLMNLKFSRSESHNFGNIGENKKGLGEEFWDYQKYTLGDPLKNIDWKKSAKFDQLFIKNNRKESSKNIWFYKNSSISMNFSYSKKIETKQTRASIIGLILIDLFLRSGEKVGIVGSEIGLQKGSDKFMPTASDFIKKKSSNYESRIKKNDIVFFISDFIENPNKLKNKMLNISENKYDGILIRILDPSELNFPYKGRNRFFDPVSGLHKLFNKSENMKDIFVQKVKKHEEKLKKICSKLGWKLFTNKTNDSYESLIFKIYNLFS